MSIERKAYTSSPLTLGLCSVLPWSNYSWGFTIL